MEEIRELQALPTASSSEAASSVRSRNSDEVSDVKALAHAASASVHGFPPACAQESASSASARATSTRRV